MVDRQTDVTSENGSLFPFCLRLPNSDFSQPLTLFLTHCHSLHRTDAHLKEYKEKEQRDDMGE